MTVIEASERVFRSYFPEQRVMAATEGHHQTYEWMPHILGE